MCLRCLNLTLTLAWLFFDLALTMLWPCLDPPFTLPWPCLFQRTFFLAKNYIFFVKKMFVKKKFRQKFLFCKICFRQKKISVLCFWQKKIWQKKILVKIFFDKIFFWQNNCFQLEFFFGKILFRRNFFLPIFSAKFL